MNRYSLDVHSLEELADSHSLDGDTYDLEYFQLERGQLEASYRGVNFLSNRNSDKAIQQPILGASQESYSKRVLMCGKSPEESTGVLIVTSSSHLRVNGELATRGDILVVPPGQDIEVLTAPGLAAFDIHIENEAMDQILIHSGIEVGRSSVLRPSRDAWLGLFRSASNLLGANEPDEGEKQDETLEFSGAVVESLTSALAQTQLVEHKRIVSPPARRRIAKLARDWLNTVLDRQVTTAEICAVTKTSARILQMAFLERYGISPVAYSMVVRLHAARNDLTELDPAMANVTSVAISRGFTHLGRFSVAYRALFDESPSTTLKRPGKQIF